MKLNSSILLIAVATIIWGATVPIMKLTLTQIPPFSLAFIRMSLASLILAVLAFRHLEIAKKDIPTFALAALTGVTLNLTLFFIGLTKTTAINASLLVAAVPILTILMAHFYLREKLDTRIVIAALLALAGVIVIVGKPTGASSLNQFIGNILLLLSALSWVIHEIIAKKLLKTYDPATVTFYSMAYGALTFFPLFVWEFWRSPQWLGNVNYVGIGGAVYGIIFASLIAYWAWQKGLAKLPAGQASFFFYLDPISGSLLSIILLKEKFTQELIIGAVLITLGVILAEQKRKSHLLLKDAVN